MRIERATGCRKRGQARGLVHTNSTKNHVSTQERSWWAFHRFIIDALFDQFAALIPTREVFHPRPRIADRIVFDKLVQVLVLGASYSKIADSTCSATTLRARRDEWIDAGIFTQLEQLCLDSTKLLICTERRTRVVEAFLALANAIIIIRRLIQQAWTTHRWDSRPARRP